MNQISMTLEVSKTKEAERGLHALVSQYIFKKIYWHGRVFSGAPDCEAQVAPLSIDSTIHQRFCTVGLF